MKIDGKIVLNMVYPVSRLEKQLPDPAAAAQP